jgi:protein-S-isoprenylcysteine O-methyltransferase Ste14
VVAVTDGVVGGPSRLSADLLFAALLLFVALDVVAVRLATGAWRRTRSKQDNFTYWIIQATQGLGLAVALGAPRWLPGLDIGGPTAATVAPALVLIAAGTIVRVSSVLTLGRFFNREVEVRADHRVVSTGLYAWVRHPSYTGTLLVFLGFSLGQSNLLSLVAGIALPTAGYIWRMKSEEAVLLGALGEDYRNYATTRKRLVPGLY